MRLGYAGALATPVEADNMVIGKVVVYRTMWWASSSFYEYVATSSKYCHFNFCAAQQ